MKLLYLYIKNYHKFKEQEFNFDSNYRFHLTRNDDGEFVLNCEHFKELEDNFFSTIPHEGANNTPVECISAIIGKNGSGKTSLCQFLHSLLLNSNEALEHVVVFQCQRDEYNSEAQSGIPVLRCQYHLLKSNTRPLLDDTGKWVYPNDAREELRITGLNMEATPWEPASFVNLFNETTVQIVYHSPFFSTEHSFESDIIIDLSTTRCLASGPGTQNEQYQNEFNSTYISPIASHKANEYSRCLNFLYYFEQKKKESKNQDRFDFGFPMPCGLNIEHESNLLKIAQSEINSFKEILHNQYDERNAHGNFEHVQGASDSKEVIAARIISLCNWIVKTIVGLHTKEFFLNSIICCFACRIRDNLSLFKSYDDNLKGEVLSTLKRYEMFKDVFSKSLAKLSNISHLDANEFLSTIQKEIIEGLKYLSPEIYIAFKLLMNLYLHSYETTRKDFRLQNYLYVKLQDKDSIDMSLAFVNAYIKSVEITNYLQISFFPHISSGEMAYISLFARVYAALTNGNPLNKEFILFLDEAETTLHPEWQRQLVRNVIRFFELFASERKVHIIFASHSPMLLSDIPDGNVILLKEDDKQTYVIQQDRRTFGANIFDLYRQSFFLSDGTIGAFAMGKINKIFRLLDCGNSLVTHLPSTLMRDINMIADPLIRRYLLSRFNRYSSKHMNNSYIMQMRIESLKRQLKEAERQLRNIEAKG